jgi:hypothetical protein
VAQSGERRIGVSVKTLASFFATKIACANTENFQIPHRHLPWLFRIDNETGFSKIGGGMARLVLICDGVDLVTHKLVGDVITIGRAPLNHIVIDNPAVSAQHAILARVADTYRLKDLNSTNGTHVNGVSVTDAVLKDGDKIRFGSVVAIFAGCCRKG